MKVCKNCGEVNANDSLFCCSCGGDAFIMQEEISCPHCGTVNDIGFKHCVNCGAALGENANEGEGYVPSPVNLREENSDVYGGNVISIPSETAKCPHCGAIVPITSIFCDKCGTAVASLHDHRIVQRKICAHCGRLNTLDAIYCAYCYYSLVDAETEELQVVHESRNLGDLTVKQAFLENVSGKSIICPNCGTPNNPDETFCVQCGLKLEIDVPKKYCPSCGTENPSDSVFCIKCRYSFDGAEPDAIEKWICPVCEHSNSKEDIFCSNCGQKRTK